MNGRRVFIACAGAAALALAAFAAPAQTTTYKCSSRGGTTYSDRVCSGGRPLGAGGARSTDKSRPVPQDRAKIARRARLTPEERAECKTLDGRIVEQQSALKAKGEGITLEDEMPLVHTQRRMRELRC